MLLKSLLSFSLLQAKYWNSKGRHQNIVRVSTFKCWYKSSFLLGFYLFIQYIIVYNITFLKKFTKTCKYNGWNLQSL